MWKHHKNNNKMKKYYLLTILLSVSLSAQVFDVKSVAGTDLEPIDVTPIGKGNFWNGKYFYSGKGTTLRLCSTDGTSPGTMLIKDFGYSGYLQHFVAVKDFVYFLIDNTSSTTIARKELWKTDGTAAGTVMIKAFTGSPNNNTSMTLISDFETYENYSIQGNEIYFSGFDDATGLEPWKTDGTSAGTVMVKDVNPGSAQSDPQGFTRVGDNIYFAIKVGVYPYSDLHKTDGTAAGTVEIGNLLRVRNSQLVPFNNKVYFFAYDNVNGIEPWVSDGTNAGTQILKNTSPQTTYYSSGPYKVIKNSNYLVFFQENYANSPTKKHIWKSDGTTNGTIRITPDEGLNFGSTQYAVFNYFFDNTDFLIYDTENKAIVKYDLLNGTSTTLALPPSLESSFSRILKFENKFYFNYNDTVNGIELWQADFSNMTSSMRANIFPGATSSIPFKYFLNNNNLYFFAKPSAAGNNLYSLKKDLVFNGSVDTNWNSPGNWDAGNVPTSVDNAVVPSGFIVNVMNPATVNAITTYSPINLTGGFMDVIGNVNLNAKITLNGNNLNLKGPSSQISNGNSTNYIVTNGTGTVNVENLNTAKGTVNLPIGTATNYNPVSIANNGTSDTFSVKVSDGISNTTNGAVNATWDIAETTAGGSNVNLTLGWNTSQQNAAFDSGTAKVGHYLNGNWTEENSGTVSNNSITATGISSFSPFAVMNFGTLAATDFSKSKVLIYPNPFNENLNISTENGGVVNFYDLSGKLVATSVLMKGTNSLNKSSLAKGVYIYQIRNTIGEILSSGKVIKK